MKVLGVVATDFFVPVELEIAYVPYKQSALEIVKNQTTVILCIEKNKEGWTLPIHGIAFFPSGNAVQEITGMDDPNVQKISDAVSKLRANRTK